MKLALLIGLDRGIQILDVPRRNGAMPPIVWLPIPTMGAEAIERGDLPQVRHDKRRFTLWGETRDYWIYEEVW